MVRLRSFLVLFASTLAAASSWSFEDGTLAVQEMRGSELGAKKSFSPQVPLKEPLTLNPTGSIRLALTVTNGGKPRKPHQAFLTLTSESTGLEESFPFTTTESGKAKLDLNRAKIPVALHSQTLQASIVIGSFGTSKPVKSNIFTFTAPGDSSATDSSSPIRYGKKPEINHIFRADPRSPPKILSLVFTLAVLVCLPALLITWLILGGNLNHLSKALGASPISHVLFFGSIIGMEFVFYMYYTSWRLFMALPVASAFGLVAFVSGSRALTEVQERRLKGER